MVTCKNDIFKIIEILENTFQNYYKPVPLHAPVMNFDDKEAVSACVESGWVSYLGDSLVHFEQQLSQVCQSTDAIAMVSGTAALHLALILAGVEPEDEVLMPPLSFVATANAAAYIGAKPHFVDIEHETLGVCPNTLRDHLLKIASGNRNELRNKQTGRRIKALIVVHTFGHPADLDGLSKVCKEFGIALVEDAAQSLGSLYKGRPVGNYGLSAAVSFNGNKIITTGGGGALLCNSPDLSEKARHIASTAKTPHSLESNHDVIGFNYRMPALNASLGLSQLNRLDEFIASKRNLARHYAMAFESLEGTRYFYEPEDCRSNYWLNTIILDDSLLENREELFQHVMEKGFLIRPAWKLLCDLSFYKTSPRSSLENAYYLQRRIVNLPSSAGWVHPK